jgi:peptidoglycan/xylan/chitin deacetylase (PgdA/CDA1 family)
VRAQRAKQLLKNATYRVLGETVSTLRLGAAGDSDRLRVLMYHKVNDIPGNPTTVPIGRFDVQMAQLAQLGYTVVDLDAVRAHFADGQPLPERAVLITFDDGYRDNVENALPVLERHGYRAVVFVAAGFVATDVPLPHEQHLRRLGIENKTLDWDAVVDADRRGLRVESHGISHRPLARLADEEAEREVRASKSYLEERLGRPVVAFSFPKGGRADFGARDVELVRDTGYELAFTTVTGANPPGADPFTLRRYNVEPYAPRTFELVLRGACDGLAAKDTRGGARARRALDAVLGTTSK